MYQIDSDFQNVVVVGDGPSGQDIANRLAGVAKNIWVSTRKTKRKPANPKLTPIGPIKKFHNKSGSIEFEDGQTIAEVDKVIYCTGYHYSHPFLRKGVRAKTALHDDGFHVDGLWQHMFWIEESSLVFLGIPKEGPTFLTSQAQAAYAARFLAGLSLLPSKAVMRRDVSADLKIRREKNLNIDTKAHQLSYPECKEYIETLQMRIVEDAASPRGSPITPDNKPFRWTKRIEWTMSNRGDIGKAYKGKACLRKKYPTPESLGFKGVPRRE